MGIRGLLARAQEELGKLREAHRTGKGPATLKDRAEAQRKAERQARETEDASRRQEKNVVELWDRYLREVVAVDNKPSTAAKKKRLWENRIKPAIGGLKVQEVTDEDVGGIVREPLRLDAEGHVVGGRAEAGNVYRLIHHMFRRALAWKWRPLALGNPLETTREPKTERRERLLAPGEVGALVKALDVAEENKTEEWQIIAAIRLAILTGARISELLNLRWDYVRRAEMEFRLPDTKTGFSRRPLAAETIALLERLPHSPGVPFVFPALTSSAKPLAYGTVEKAFRRIAKSAGLKDCTLHTIRHWFATAAANSVSNPRIGMALTGHKSHAAYMNYIHGDKEQARALADQLAELAKGLGATPPNVVPLTKAAEN